MASKLRDITPAEHATLGGIPFRINPNSVRWAFDMKVAQYETVGGRVVQIFGSDIGDMTVDGEFGNGDKSKGDQEGWEEQTRFAHQVRAWAEQAQRNGKPLQFVYSPKGWNFSVYVKAFSNPDGGMSVQYDNKTFNPKWRLTLFMVEDHSNVVLKGIQDEFIGRLMNGVGWKQTEYNGPLVDSRVNIEDTLRQRAKDALEGGGIPLSAVDQSLGMG